MEENKQTATIKCKHEDCGRSFRVVLPKSPGAYKVKCPNGHDNIIKFVPKNIKIACPNPHETKGEQPTDNPAKSKSIASVDCPWECGKNFKFEIKTDGLKECACPNCNGDIKINIQNGKVVSIEKENTQRLSHTTPLDGNGNTGTQLSSKGKLMLVRFKGLLGGMGNKTYHLHTGSNTVGRYDPDLRCDIEIKGDSYASRRSVVIEVMEESAGTLYKMTVLRAANPVMHNNRPLTVGESLYLNYGDSIKLGNTTFNFEKA